MANIAPKRTPAQIAAELLKPESAKKEIKQPVKVAEQKKPTALPVKRYFDVRIECMLPGTITYRVLAENAEQAVDLIKGQAPVSVKHQLAGRRESKLTVYDSGSTMIRYVKRLFGG